MKIKTSRREVEMLRQIAKIEARYPDGFDATRIRHRGGEEWVTKS